jgi:hypothetical protein
MNPAARKSGAKESISSETRAGTGVSRWRSANAFGSPAAVFYHN